jgi:hypothetical protein
MKPYPLVMELIAPVLRVGMPRAVGSRVFLRGYIPPRNAGRCRFRRLVPEVFWLKFIA